MQATWLHAAHARAVSAYPDSTIWAEPSAPLDAPKAQSAAAEAGTQSELPAPTEAPAQLQPEPAASAMLAKYDAQHAEENSATETAKQREKEEDEDLDLGPDDWDDILSAWMGAVGLTDMLEASQPAESASGERSLFLRFFLKAR